jgi:hypothetical protein
VADKLGSEMPFTQPRLEPGDKYRIVGSFRVLELALVAWCFRLAIGAGILVTDFVLDRWAEEVGLFRIQTAD